MQFEKVSAKKVSDFILEQLEEAIILKDFLAEEQLPTERELAAVFKASRLAVREALSELESKGLIEKRIGAKGGTFVLPLTINSHQRTREEVRGGWDDMLKVFEYRSIIEPEAAYLAAKRISTAELELLRGFIETSMEEDCTREIFRSLDVKFHLSIAKASGNDYFEKAVRRIRTKINPALDLMPYNENVRRTSYDKHMLLLDALHAGDGNGAKEAMKQHIDETVHAIYARVVVEGDS